MEDREVRESRWDGASVHELRGTYGEYVLGKVSKVFPELRRDVELLTPGPFPGA